MKRGVLATTACTALALTGGFSSPPSARSSATAAPPDKPPGPLDGVPAVGDDQHARVGRPQVLPPHPDRVRPLRRQDRRATGQPDEFGSPGPGGVQWVGPLRHEHARPRQPGHPPHDLRDPLPRPGADLVPAVGPADPFGVIEDRKRLVESGRAGGNARPARGDGDLRYWLGNALASHRFTAAEAGAALGMTADEVTAAAKRLGIDPARRPEGKAGDPLLVLPYPGGRHPRAGFRDGAIRPQRETKASVFAPWAGGGYAVADVPEAVWFEPAGKPELLYLAHTHVPTTWDRRKVKLDPLEWTRHEDGSLTLERTLPNMVALASKVVPAEDGVRMEFRVTNGSAEKLTGLRVQMCVMLAGLTGFDRRTNDNKVFAAPFAACKDATGKRWVITAWERCGRAWGNPPCPCLHADPVVADCPPGESRAARGWLSFYEGTDIDAELRRLRTTAFE
jgi:hypothetical protein